MIYPDISLGISYVTYSKLFIRRKNFMKIKKVLSVIVAYALVFGLVPMVTAGAEEEVSIPISNRAELEAIADNLGGTYHLTADIDLGGANWSPLRTFTGTLDGRGYVIRNLTYRNLNRGGLFFDTDGATIKNLGFVDTNITGGPGLLITGITTGTYLAGALAGEAYNTNISNCYVTGSVDFTRTGTAPIQGLVSAETRISISVGGLVGYMQRGKINSCYNMANISAGAHRATNNFAYAGGLVGEAEGVTIHDVYNRGNVTASSTSGTNRTSLAGGIVGFMRNSIMISLLYNAYNTGTMSASPAIGNGVNLTCGFVAGVAATVFVGGLYDKPTASTIFEDFDMVEIWGVVPGINDNLPVLRGFYNFCAVCDKDPCECIDVPDLCIECKKEICVCCPDCKADPCECIDAPDLCIECKKEICVCCSDCKKDPCECVVLCVACGEDPCVCVAISNVIGDATATITPNMMITVAGNTFLLDDPSKLTLKVEKKTPENEDKEKFFTALKTFLT
jgi:hypothetical protein